MRDWLKPVAPSQTSTSATDGQSRSIARASSMVRLGRRATSRKLLHDDGIRPELRDGVAERLIEAADERRHPDDRRDPDDDAEHRQRRAHLARAQRVDRHDDDFGQESRAYARHYSRLMISIVALLAPQGFNRIQFRGPHRGVQAEEQT